MLFSSIEFLFVFLPLALLGYILLRKATGQKHIYVWLSVVSIIFYSWWDVTLSWLILCSIIFNFTIGKKLSTKAQHGKKSMTLLSVGILANLCPLFYYKYSVFFMETVSHAMGSEFNFQNIILPLGISFFTFQQITYIVDAHKGNAKDYTFFHYTTFVSFFPQLIAGPIVHHSEIMPQFDSKSKRFSNLAENLEVGLSIFAIGLFKKVIIADPLGALASPIFLDSQTTEVEFFSAWIAALSYTLQLYFDFSGYSDMAIGIARMFGITLPANFYSPYKATSIIEFWRRWHITLSRFLRDYIYIPLGGNRRGQARRHVNLMATMLIGGLWHGAGWTFIFWGFLHGLYLIVNHLWVRYCPFGYGEKNTARVFLSWAATFIAVVVGWVFFRAETFSSAINILKGMVFINGIEIPKALFPFSSFALNVSWIEIVPGGGTALTASFTSIFLSTIILFFGKNVIQLFQDFDAVLDNRSFNRTKSKLEYRPSRAWALFVAILLYISITKILGSKSSEFLYFNF